MIPPSRRWASRKKHIEWLSAKVAEGHRHTEQLLQQVIEASHKADTRYVEMHKKLEQVTDLVKLERRLHDRPHVRRATEATH